jgi:hypothetical protein
MQDPSVPEAQYFNPATGEPLRWYAKLPNGHIDMFTLPGFHPKYGIRLLPATSVVVAEYHLAQVDTGEQRLVVEEQGAQSSHKCVMPPDAYI